MSRFGSQFKQRKPKMKRIQNISLSLMSLLSECGGHQGTPRTLLLALFLLLALTSCQKRPQPTTPEDQKTLIGFSPVSQSAAVKSTTSLSTIHDDFGVWGIARQEGNNTPYVLWDNNRLSQVKQSSTEAETYIPVSNAYWLSGYKYNFIAIAPYEEGLASTYSTLNSKDALIFPYNMGTKYENSDYAFDLLAAVAETSVGTQKPQHQILTFWHLFAQINITVTFKDENGNVTTGSVAEVRLHNIDADANYIISFDENNGLYVSCTSETTQNSQRTLSLEEPVTLNIIPQDITDFELYLDYTYGEGETAVSYKNYKVELNPNGTNQTYYGNNAKFNWNINIGPKETISFNVSVAPWTETPVPDGDEDTDNNEIEII